MISYMLLNCGPGTESEVISEISSISGVDEVNGILGKYDVFVKISADTPDVMELIISQIRRVRAENSHTLPVVYGQGGTVDKEIQN
ncbi:AsnC family transcriptional regulator protein [Marine Group I thaumarchaeote SCGC AAA799-E16]|uniref:AsnC family transcriptional regulator protein n=4 Tax=Marine Group I TaxID=905826 RepID=A0A081RNS6_9ARCH|nr:AsnC family transcriptional regulator protein [Marine Group I thaumarchaeote SCGC AAA799-N04]KER05876.1 AsnC family transcriptional regulator protein [Marine Group I thaumarchaeote SCGC AAA799-E16]KFM16261.1 AsnC family transcriptional regulator protein [Marine Group I thaumarchaeote SCGC AAA799-D11]KFM16470.1 AsnC family transcriptional regulator protein [Marine Group I thaumarchaeote SCGC RSA3]